MFSFSLSVRKLKPREERNFFKHTDGSVTELGQKYRFPNSKSRILTSFNAGNASKPCPPVPEFSSSFKHQGRMPASYSIL